LLARLAIAVSFVVSAAAASAAACPFCTQLEPTLAARRDAAAIVAVGEILQQDRQTTTVLVHQPLKGADQLAGRKSLRLSATVGLRPGSLVLLFGDASAAETATGKKIADGNPPLTRFTPVAVSETSLAYFAAAPALRKPAQERLPYFVRFLEHPDPLLAEDAYLEFGHASFDEVRSVADRLPMPKLRDWLADARVAPTHKGFYGLALALAASADDRRDNVEFLRKAILEPASDFRAGFDGVLGGFLLLSGEPGLALVEERYLVNPRAADGDLRHALTALRFYREYGRDISAERLAEAWRKVLTRPEFAEPAVNELARLHDWPAADQIAGLYTNESYTSPALRRAVVGYLSTCPLPAAAGQLKRLRSLDPEGVAAAERGPTGQGESRQ
jgi:hypothetical protein